MRISDEDFAEISALAALWRDAPTVEHYGEQHPENWTCAEVDRDRGVASWPGLLTTLTATDVNYSVWWSVLDRLEVRRSNHSRQQLLQLQATLQATLVDRCQREGWVSCGIGVVGTAVRVTLPPGAAHVAEELGRAYGDAIKVDFGVYQPLSKDGD